MLCRRLAIEWLVEGRAEVALITGEIAHRDLETRPLQRDELVFIVPAGHPWAGGQPIEPRDLSSLPLIVASPRPTQTQCWPTSWRSAAWDGELKVAMALSDPDAITLSVEAGVGGAFVPRLAAARALSLGCVAEVTIRGVALTQTIYLAQHRHRSATSPQQAFWSFACNTVNDALQPL